MLVELRIRDYAVIEDLSVDVTPGLNVVTGETGAGKSIIVGALSLLLGERASSGVIRAGSGRAIIEAVFDVEGSPELAPELDDMGIEPEESLLVFRREVAARGRNRAWINGSPATVSSVARLGNRLVDIHGQHEHQSLLRSAEQRAILDVFATSGELADRVRSLHASLMHGTADLEAREARLRELENRSDFLRFQLREIEGARLEPDEDRLLEEEARRLEHSEELVREAGRLHEELYDDEEAISARLASLRRLLGRLARIDSSLTDAESLLREGYHAVTEVGRRLGDYAADISHDPGRLDELRRRLDLIFRLKRKYGPELKDVMETRRRIEGELAELETASFDLQDLEREIGETRLAFEESVAQLSGIRGRTASELAGQVEKLLPELGMPGARFRIGLAPLPGAGAGGGERIEFRASLNPGFEPRSLSKIASGGELSRVMLALKAILAQADRISTLVFDEVDAGIGGIVATRIAEKLREVAQHHQVFVVTHLPQLAAEADTHFSVTKKTAEGLAVMKMRKLSGERRVREIARMLGGDPESNISRRHARELLRHSSTSSAGLP